VHQAEAVKMPNGEPGMRGVLAWHRDFGVVLGLPIAQAAGRRSRRTNFSTKRFAA